MGSEALHEAVRDGRKEAVNDLLERGVPINLGDVADGRTPLHIAAEVGNPEMMQLLCSTTMRVRQPCVDASFPRHR